MASTTTSKSRQGSAQRRHLRLSRGGVRHAATTANPPSWDFSAQPAELDTPHLTPARPRILIAGADPERRATVRRDLTESLPAETMFGEAGAAWEVLEQAPSSGVVMLAGDLDEVSAESLMHVLGHRHPSLPVVALGLFADGCTAGGGTSSPAVQALQQ